MDSKPKTIFQLESPYTPIEWPKISTQDQNTLLELLCSLLSPISQYRTLNITPSKGKRSKKRKRQEAKSSETSDTALPPRPEISSFISVGLNSISRILEASTRKLQAATPDNETPQNPDPSYINALPKDGNEKVNAILNLTTNPQPPTHYSAIFVCRSSHPSILHAHLPQMIAAASLAQPSLPATRLVQLPPGSEERLSKALGLPRVSFLGILSGAPHAASLVDLVQECVKPIEIPWLREAKEQKYLPVKINAIQTTAGLGKKAKK